MPRCNEAKPFAVNLARRPPDAPGFAFPQNCPECRAEYPTGQGLASHRRLVHDYDALSDALSGVKGYRLTGRERDL